MTDQGVRRTVGQVPAQASDATSDGSCEPLPGGAGEPVSDGAGEPVPGGAGEPVSDGPGAGLAASASPVSPAVRARAERRAERITAGVTELERRLADLLRGGLVPAGRSGPALWEETAARMVDAQAQGLANRVRELGALAATGADAPVRLLEECALLHLLVRAWLRRERLPEPLAATVRSRVGLTASPEGPAIRDDWLVLARYDTSDSRLTTRRTWLYGATSGRTALLLSYGAAGRAPGLALPAGLAVDAELTAYPGAGQPRMALTEQFAPPAPTTVRPPGTTTSGALARYGAALRDDPWRESVPVTLDGVVPVPDGDGWQLADADADHALPIGAAARSRPGLWRLVALSGGAPVRVFGECGPRGFTPLAAWPQGRGEAVPLC
ncbi:hypothetical protein C1708_12905 [Streptomyces sp. DH-12]|uniref:hypothetical protein n=1 Tax=Streptomyces sp. DH-12 TaxID=2072509 RepID=UPI000CCEFE6A|nr:hypothetical protein [Streptomyces sp. DH-12]PNV33111.1 hypothetical protein C1708_12905 [Streptomyces sp. DH-12]